MAAFAAANFCILALYGYRIVDMRLLRLSSAWLTGVVLTLSSSSTQDKPEYVFGTTVVDTSGLQGRGYHLKPGTHALPKFEQLRPVGSIYTTSLNVWPQNFDQGFPNISDRFEWFAIEYTGRIWIENSGHYRFSLLADDGAKLYLNNQAVIDNGGAHGSYAISGSATLTRVFTRSKLNTIRAHGSRLHSCLRFHLQVNHGAFST